MNHRFAAGLFAAAAVPVSADALVCGPAGTGVTRGALIDLRNDGASPIRVDSLDYHIGAGVNAPPSATVNLKVYSVLGGWSPAQGNPGLWTINFDQDITHDQPHGTQLHLDLAAPLVINPGELYGFALVAEVASLTNQTRALTVVTNSPPSVGNGTLTALAGAIINNSSLQANQFGIGTRMYSGKVNYTVLGGCDPDLTTGAVQGQPGYGVPNGVLNNEDFFYYLAQFAAGNLAVADLTHGAVPGQPGYGIPNAFLNNDDFFYYLTIFAAGC